MDPYYASGKFYDALVKIETGRPPTSTMSLGRYRTADIPEAYRDHEADARVLASA